MGIMLRFILLALFFYIIFRLLRIAIITRRDGTAPDTGATHRRAQPPPRIDKTKATEADFEEIKGK
jgi:hypothetical protein